MDYRLDDSMEINQNENTNRAFKQLRNLSIKEKPPLDQSSAKLQQKENTTRQKLTSVRNMKADNSIKVEKHISDADSHGDSVDGSATDEAEMSHLCICCTGYFASSDIIQTQCAHTYCHECLVRLFENSLTDESLFPPRCCRTLIGISTAIEDIIGLDMIKRYKERKTELSENNRTYCSNSSCSRYIPPQNIRRGIGSCDSCMVRTCVECKKQGHRGDCEIEREKDENDDALLERLAKKKKWQRCSKCSRIVERISGCRHMFCQCGWQFCYVCGAQWRTCKCSN